MLFKRLLSKKRLRTKMGVSSGDTYMYLENTFKIDLGKALICLKETITYFAK